jgi:multiple sugar transport system permease protein
MTATTSPVDLPPTPLTRKKRRRQAVDDPLAPPVAMRRFVYLALAVASAFYILPFLLAVITSFKTLPDYAANTSSLTWDAELGSPTLDGVRGLSSDRILFPRWTFNSVLVTTCVVIGRVLLSALAGYSLARIRFPGYKVVFGLILSVMMIPGIVLAIPRFLLLKELGWINSYAGLIVPLVFDAFGIFLMKQFMEQIPIELEEAAAIDGAGRFTTFVKVILPIARPAVITLTILSTVGAWNEFLHPLIAANQNDMRTLPVGLAQLRGQFGSSTPWPTIMAASVIMTIPMAVIYFVFQRYFREGMSGAVKG